MATDFAGVIAVLADAGVEFIVVDDLAAQAHGSARLTQDADFVYRRTPENIERLTSALAPHSPYLRGAPPGLPFRFDAATVRRGLNFTLTTTLGDADFLGEMTGSGTYEQVILQTVRLSVFGRDVLVVDVPGLIQAKRAAGRPKDLETIAELEALLAERERSR